MGNHYVPQYYLKGFQTSATPGCIWAVRDGREPFLVSVSNIAQENRLYSPDLEQQLANEVEGPANEVILRIQNQQPLTPEQKLVLSRYLELIWRRVPAQREWAKRKYPEISQPIYERIELALLEKLESASPAMKPNYQRSLSKLDELRRSDEEGDEHANEIWLQTLSLDVTPRSAEALSKMRWCFMVAPRNSYYITSDNPFYFFQSMGIGRVGSEVSFPVTQGVALWATWRNGLDGDYHQAPSQFVKEVNRRTARACTSLLLSPRSEDWIVDLANKPRESIRVHMLGDNGRIIGRL